MTNAETPEPGVNGPGTPPAPEQKRSWWNRLFRKPTPSPAEPLDFRQKAEQGRLLPWQQTGELDWPLILLALLIVLVLLGLALLLYFWWPVNHCRQARECHQTVASHKSAQMQGAVITPAKRLTEQKTAACPPRDLLRETQAARLTDAYEKIDRAVRHTPWISAQEVAEAKKHLRDHPNGDHPAKITSLPNGYSVETWWDTKITRKPIDTVERCTCAVHTDVYVREAPPKPKPVIHRPVGRRAEVHTPSVPVRRIERCFAFYLDGRGFHASRMVAGHRYPGVKMPLQTTIEFYQHDGGADDVYAAMNSGCFYVVDMVTGERLYLNRECIGCPNGEQRIWPRDIRMNTKATLIVTIRTKSGRLGCPSGACIVYVPYEWAREVSVLWCFAALEDYMGNDDDWNYHDYYNRASLSDILPDLPRGRYHEAITPVGILGFKGQVLALGYSE